MIFQKFFSKNSIIFGGFFAFILVIILIGWLTAWNENNFPNPMINVTACNMAYPSHICDPDTVIFSKTRRNSLSSKLNLFKEITGNLNVTGNLNKSDEMCERKGVTAAIALAENFHDYSEEGMKKFAKATLSKWNLDSECKKSFLIFIFHRDETKRNNEITEYSIALDENVPFTECGFWKIYHSIYSRSDIVADLNTILEKLVQIMENGEDSDSECTKDEAWHLIFGSWGTILSVLFFISGCTGFCCWRSFCKHVEINGSNNIPSNLIIHQEEPPASQLLIEKL